MKSPNEPYQPSNGTEGECFIAKWCEHCEKERRWRASEGDGSVSGCDILGRTMAFSIGDPGYPEEWQYVDGKPACTAFESEEDAKVRRAAKRKPRGIDKRLAIGDLFGE